MFTHNMKFYLHTLIGFGDKAYKRKDTTFVQFLHFAPKLHGLWYVERIDTAPQLSLRHNLGTPATPATQ